MRERILYEYATIRVVPKVEREEFLNVGIILFSKSEKYIKFEYLLNRDRLVSFAKDLDVDLIEQALHSYQKIAAGEETGGDIAALEIPERFRWLTAVRSACVQTSRPHSGLTHNLDYTFNKLFEEMVLE
ncbi:DUF3037 domain-containing protein [Bacteroidales bacterium OttesenSCG-928-B11]|nr:DUF3037 domain-containing protein [Bacteroidales bacterium OttesenSCG-928-C03]MDL2311838.1 DUF3037 domain-containing protein [Bacteroidales bacterium OttesenSCG-928-B11]MDL2325512.1 DUF3037 domain-containing protein [Bacteroidales bacterium OttesenSCG-928-A14]